MRYLLVKEKNKKFSLYCPDTYGAETWGGTHQESLIKKRKNWYIQSWTAGNDWIEDDTYEFKLNVVKETADLDEIIRYLVKNNESGVDHIFKEARELYNKYLDLTEFFHRNY
jgi:hypothetical protein